MHAYLSGNFAPVNNECGLTPCPYVGDIPEELWGGQYIRNGGNPNPAHFTSTGKGERTADYHWFDGDGMLSGVFFQRDANGGVTPCFVNKFLITDVYLAEKSLTGPLLPSITTLVSPDVPLRRLSGVILRSLWLSLKSAVLRISVANTNIIFHARRALATCESGPPLEVHLPGLETVDWWTFGTRRTAQSKEQKGLGSKGGLAGMFEEWMTAHPRIDPITSELIFFGSSFLPPFVRYSVISSSGKPLPSLLAHPLPIPSPKMMHDFGASLKHSIILDLPLTLNPRNMLRGYPIVRLAEGMKSRFGVLPRYEPDNVRWFESEPCVIFHTANSWDEVHASGETTAVCMLACRFRSANLVYAAGGILSNSRWEVKDDVCRLFFYRFDMRPGRNVISDEYALSAIPFEFPSLSHPKSMQYARYIYGCTMREGSFDAALGRAVKIDCLAKMDVHHLIARPDSRSVPEILRDQQGGASSGISIFEMPKGWYAQECTFVARETGTDEDDGWLVTYVFDESQLMEDGSVPEDARSELWIIDARDMRTVVAKIRLPQRVPYGLHGTFVTERQIDSQYPIEELQIRTSSGGPELNDFAAPIMLCLVMIFNVLMWSRVGSRVALTQF
ncbi:carotenoid cleavage dioxygenase 1 [Sistotremastrum suecicum HHB10207 ss-3]|uniref:Carotenoid cleavage dioxygenase 1 n=1 Tax=Sistotremastrum suecicum HHB10207 ss-3 TaxID=1314776 RepID=A0A166CH25_9AGAM|nr:carotenoid cleavage dioxygenase 1 [Sistotremastrum suecicum HHB10207 ss-3]